MATWMMVMILPPSLPGSVPEALLPRAHNRNSARGTGAHQRGDGP
jgi:hypothetical protein